MDKKICIMGAVNLKHMTLASLYTDEFDRNNQKYHVIYLDKYHIDEKNNAENSYCYRLDLNPKWSFFHKFLYYWSFRKYAIDILEKENYDFVVVWNEFSAFMFSDYLNKNYKGKYSINIRDYNYNNIFFVKNRLKQAVDNAAFTTISSDKFMDFLPKHEYLFVHSYNKKLLDNLQVQKRKIINDRPIGIMFIGRLSYPETMQRVINSLGNDQRYKLFLIGAGCGSFKNYIEDRNYENIIIHDSFEPDATGTFLQDADIIYSINKENEIFSDVLLPIKLYYAIHLHIPIIAFESSYTYEYAKKHSIGIGITETRLGEVGDIVEKQYHSLKQEDIDRGCEEAMREIQHSQSMLRKKIEDVIL